MRLTCPNCNAQYEVEDSVIPAAGRDVQCSACGHSWFQYPADVALQMRAADLDDDDDQPGFENPQMPPRIDRTVLDVLREEAERELAARTQRAPLESQGDLGLVPSRPRNPPAASDSVSPTPAPRTTSRRRNLLPDIEELSTTLEPGSDPRRAVADEDMPPLPPTMAEDQRGFRRGLSLVVLVGMALAILYLLADLIGQSVPALADPLAGYVALVDWLRVTLADQIRMLWQRFMA